MSLLQSFICMGFSFLPFRRLQINTPDSDLVVGPLKLATLKYQAGGMRARIVSHLETDWPTTLEGWDEDVYAIDSPQTDTSDDEPQFRTPLNNLNQLFNWGLPPRSCTFYTIGTPMRLT
jgi:hypothetical protein